MNFSALEQIDTCPWAIDLIVVQEPITQENCCREIASVSARLSSCTFYKYLNHSEGDLLGNPTIKRPQNYLNNGENDEMLVRYRSPDQESQHLKL